MATRMVRPAAGIASEGPVLGGESPLRTGVQPFPTVCKPKVD